MKLSELGGLPLTYPDVSATAGTLPGKASGPVTSLAQRAITRRYLRAI